MYWSLCLAISTLLFVGKTSSLCMNNGKYSIDEDGIVTYCMLIEKLVQVKAEWGDNEAAVMCREVGACTGDACKNAVDISQPKSPDNLLPVMSCNFKCDSPDLSGIADCTQSVSGLTDVPDVNGVEVVYAVDCNPIAHQTSPAAVDPCPGGHYFAPTNKCIRFVLEPLKWNQAMTECTSQPGNQPNLLCIRTEDELEFVRNLIISDTALSSFSKYWTAANILDSNIWRYGDTAEEVTFDAWGWGRNEPNGVRRNVPEYCVNMRKTRKSPYMLNDSKCRKKARPICETTV